MNHKLIPKGIPHRVSRSGKRSSVLAGNVINPRLATKYSIIFRAGVGANDAAFLGNTVATPVLVGRWIPSGRDDWVIMKMTACIGKRQDIGWLDSSSLMANDLVGRRAVSLGFGGDRKRGQLSAGRGVITSLNGAGLLAFTGSLVSGESGGPLIVFINGVPVVAGVITKENNARHGVEEFSAYTETHANFLQSYYEISSSPLVHNIIDQDKSTQGITNPNWRLHLSDEFKQLANAK